MVFSNSRTRPEDDKTKNDHFLDMIDKAEERGFNPEFVLFDNGMQM